MCVCLFALPLFVARSAATDAAARIFALCALAFFFAARFGLALSSAAVAEGTRAPPPNAAPAAPRRDDGAEPEPPRAPRLPAPRRSRSSRTRVTAAWPRFASSPRVPRFFSASRRADAAPRGGIGGVSPRGKRQSAGSAARWRVAGALAGGAPRSDRESSDVRSNDRCQFVVSTSSRKSHSRRPAHSRRRASGRQEPILFTCASRTRSRSGPSDRGACRATGHSRARRCPPAFPSPPRAHSARRASPSAAPRARCASPPRGLESRARLSPPTFHRRDRWCDATSSAHALKP